MLTLGCGGNMQFSIMNAGGAAGTDYSTINVAGTLDITATPGSPFTIQLISVCRATASRIRKFQLVPVLPMDTGRRRDDRRILQSQRVSGQPGQLPEPDEWRFVLRDGL